MVKAFKRVGRECGVPVMLLAQLNREVEKRTDERVRDDAENAAETADESAVGQSDAAADDQRWFRVGSTTGWRSRHNRARS